MVEGVIQPLLMLVERDGCGCGCGLQLPWAGVAACLLHSPRSQVPQRPRQSQAERSTTQVQVQDTLRYVSSHLLTSL